MEAQPQPQVSSVFGAIAAPQGDAVVYQGTLQKQKKTPGVFNKIPRWGEREASIKFKVEYTGYGPSGNRIYYLTWTSETDPTGERNVIEFRRVAEVKLKQISGGYQFKITMIPNESGETKEYWFKSVGKDAREWVGQIGTYVGNTRYRLADPGTPLAEQKIALTQYDGGTGLWTDIIGMSHNIKGSQGGGRRKKKRTKRRTKKRKPRTKKRTKKRKARTKRELK